jgi:hypothetical protein
VNEYGLAANLVEQCSLIEGIAYGFCRVLRQGLLERFDILEVEQEHLVVLDCTCGLGHGKAEDHVARGCQGIGEQLRPDFVAKRKSDGAIGFHDFKTAALINDKWDRQWNYSRQMALLPLAIPEATHFYIHGIVKGMRPWDKVVGAKWQDSPFCYAYYKKGNPPVEPSEWAAQFWYTDEDGKNRQRTESKGWQKIPVWEKRSIKSWVEAMPLDVIQPLFQERGPFPVDGDRTREVALDHVVHERKWQKALWEGEHIEKSWHCYEEAYGSVCEYAVHCWKETPGSEKPEEILGEDGQPLFVQRTPHHEAERERKG